MTTEEEVIEPPTNNTKNTTNTKISAKEKEETWLNKEDSGQCENPKDLQGITGGQVLIYESFATVGEIRVWWRADFQSGSRVLKKVS